MSKPLAVLSVAAMAGVLASWGSAAEVTTYQSYRETSVTTSSATQPSAETVPAPAAAVPMTTPDTQANAAPAQEETAAQDMAGTVQSVDRRNRSLVLQDSQGKNFAVSLNDNTRFYRKGEAVSYRDIEPHDIIQVRYRS